MTQDAKLNPQIYVICLNAYYQGYSHGCWIHANQCPEMIQAEIQQMLDQSPVTADEWEIRDYIDFCGVEFGEFVNAKLVSHVAALIASHSALAGELLSYYNNDFDTTKKALENNYQGVWGSELDYAEALFDELYAEAIPENLRGYIDYKQFCYELFINDCFSIRVKNEVHVFNHYQS